jgi:hypothetical protein
MERLYGESIAKLLTRVELLEASRSGTGGAGAGGAGGVSGPAQGTSGPGPVSAAGTRASSGPAAAPVRRVQTQPSAVMQSGIRAMGGLGGMGPAPSGPTSALAAAAVAAAYPASTRNRAAIHAGSSITGGGGGAGAGAGAVPRGAVGGGTRTPDLLPRHPSLSDPRTGGRGVPGAGRASVSAPAPVLAASDSTGSITVGAEELGMDLGEARSLLAALIGRAT